MLMSMKSHWTSFSISSCYCFERRKEEEEEEEEKEEEEC
tara:strand:- start:84 stop:200 length:117 start_codon:yes stop_codon:yes gene_type:complete